MYYLEEKYGNRVTFINPPSPFLINGRVFLSSLEIVSLRNQLLIDLKNTGLHDSNNIL